MRSDGRLGARRSDAYARRYGGRKRRRGVRPLSGRVPDSRALSGTVAGEVLRRGARIRRRGDVAAAHGRRNRPEAVHLREHRAVAALPAGASRRGVQSGDARTLPHRIRFGTRGRRGAGRSAGARRRRMGQAGRAQGADGGPRAAGRGPNAGKIAPAAIRRIDNTLNL